MCLPLTYIGPYHGGIIWGSCTATFAVIVDRVPASCNKDDEEHGANIVLLPAPSDAGYVVSNAMPLVAARKVANDYCRPPSHPQCMYACVSMHLFYAGPPDCDDRCGVASARDIEGGNMRMGWPDQILGLNSSWQEPFALQCVLATLSRRLRSLYAVSGICWCMSRDMPNTC